MSEERVVGKGPPSYQDSLSFSLPTLSEFNSRNTHPPESNPMPLKTIKPCKKSEFDSIGQDSREPNQLRPKVVLMNGFAFDQYRTEKGTQLVRRTLSCKSKLIACQFCTEVVETIAEEVSARQLMGDADYERERNKALCILLIPPGWIFIPFFLCMFNRKGITHMCPNCNEYIGMYYSGESRFFYTPGSIQEKCADFRARANQL